MRQQDDISVSQSQEAGLPASWIYQPVSSMESQQREREGREEQGGGGEVARADRLAEQPVEGDVSVHLLARWWSGGRGFWGGRGTGRGQLKDKCWEGRGGSPARKGGVLLRGIRESWAEEKWERGVEGGGMVGELEEKGGVEGGWSRRKRGVNACFGCKLFKAADLLLHTAFCLLLGLRPGEKRKGRGICAASVPPSLQHSMKGTGERDTGDPVIENGCNLYLPQSPAHSTSVAQCLNMTSVRDVGLWCEGHGDTSMVRSASWLRCDRRRRMRGQKQRQGDVAGLQCNGVAPLFSAAFIRGLKKGRGGKMMREREKERECGESEDYHCNGVLKCRMNDLERSVLLPGVRLVGTRTKGKVCHGNRVQLGAESDAASSGHQTVKLAPSESQASQIERAGFTLSLVDQPPTPPPSPQQGRCNATLRSCDRVSAHRFDSPTPLPPAPMQAMVIPQHSWVSKKQAQLSPEHGPFAHATHPSGKRWAHCGVKFHREGQRDKRSLQTRHRRSAGAKSRNTISPKRSIADCSKRTKPLG
ncbi:hypothetical protein JZ751_000518 [Albula glossodonta]|uniref:Uncharacterized protein n=1 Tax=Albula glossodonta TaxID=121402 RepID=A0A8T2PWD8_9TELE|nr:hypothetical protein JZ751_000518 [Albula glossodonta]